MTSDFDETKDYYNDLGLTSTATFEEIKAAHIQLALKFHPDMAHSSSDKSINPEERTARFRGVSEAWFVLSKAELRSQYDSARIRLGKMTISSQSMTGPDMKVEIPTSFNTQRDSFTVALKKAGSDWKNNRDKYKCEVWHKLSHNEKKLSRARRHGSLLGDLLQWGALFGVAALGSHYAYKVLFHRDSSYNSLARLRPKKT